MTKIQDTIDKRLGLYKSSQTLSAISKNGKKINVQHASEKFLREHFVSYCQDNGSQEEFLAWLECIHMAARPLARAIISEKVRLDSGLPDSELQFEHIALYNQNKMLQLIKHANATKEILESGLPCCITAHNATNIYHRTEAGTVKHLMREPTLVQRLAALVDQLEANTAKEIKTPKGKRGYKPYRKDILLSLTMAWHEITGKPPEKLKRDRTAEGDPIYGDFYEFMEAARRFIGGLINFDFDVGEAIKDTNAYWREYLELQSLTPQK